MLFELHFGTALIRPVNARHESWFFVGLEWLTKETFPPNSCRDGWKVSDHSSPTIEVTYLSDGLIKQN